MLTLPCNEDVVNLIELHTPAAITYWKYAICLVYNCQPLCSDLISRHHFYVIHSGCQL